MRIDSFWNRIEKSRQGADLWSRGRMDKQGQMIKAICASEGITITELAERLGISRQALYKRLEGGMRYESFYECIRALGYDLYYGKDGKVRKIE